MSEALSPMGSGKSSPLGALMTLLAVVVFFEIGGPVHLTAALARSYEAIPFGPPVALAGRPHAMAMVAIAASAKLIESAIGLCAPAIVALLLADIVLGMIGRAVPEIPLYFVGMPLKALLGVGAFLLGLASMDIALQHGLRGFFDLLELAFQIRP
jgi:flagellar biosynthesis protein FliR